MTLGPAELVPVDQAGLMLIDAATYTDDATMHLVAASLRRQDPIHQIENPEYPTVWALARHSDVVEVAKNSEAWPQAKPHSLRSYAELEALSKIEFPPLRFLVNMDGAEHREYRTLTASWFRPRTLHNRLDARLADLATQSVDRLEQLGGSCDFAEEIAIPYPMQVILALMGLPPEDYPLMLRLTQQMLCPADPAFEIYPGASPDATFCASVEQFYKYFLEVQDQRRANPTGDISSIIANARMDGAELPVDAAVGYYVVFAVAGHDTAASSIAAGARAFAEHPQQWERLRANPELIDSASDEIIRWASPARHFLRTAAFPYQLSGHQFEAGDTVLLSYPSANRDETVFDQPFVFDIERNPNPHVAFGSGPHFCLGSHLAKLEVKAVFSKLAKRVRSFEVTGQAHQVASIAAGGLSHLPMHCEFA